MILYQCRNDIPSAAIKVYICGDGYRVYFKSDQEYADMCAKSEDKKTAMNRALIKQAATKRIKQLSPEWRQLNLIYEKLDIIEKLLGIEDAKELSGVNKKICAIKMIRELSNNAETTGVNSDEFKQSLKRLCNDN